MVHYRTGVHMRQSISPHQMSLTGTRPALTTRLALQPHTFVQHSWLEYSCMHFVSGKAHVLCSGQLPAVFDHAERPRRPSAPAWRMCYRVKRVQIRWSLFVLTDSSTELRMC